MNNQRVIVAGWCTVDPKKRDQAVESFQELVRRARSAPGCLDLSMSADPVEPDRVNLFELWRSEKDLNAWRKACKHPKRVTRLLQIQVEKHVVDHSGPPFSSGARRRKT